MALFQFSLETEQQFQITDYNMNCRSFQQAYTCDGLESLKTLILREGSR